MAMDAAKISKLKAKAFDVEKTALEGLLAAAAPDLADVEAQVTLLRGKYEELKVAYDKLAEKHIADGNDAEFTALETEKSKYFKLMYSVDLKATRLLDREASTVAGGTTPASRVTLPQRKLLEFSGDVRDWLPFWSSFEDIDSSTDISDADKFQYLLQCVPVTSSARKCIDGFTVSAKNYKAAIETLKNLYGRSRMLVKVFVRDLLELVIKNATESSKVDFMELYPKLSSHIRNLKELGVTSDKCEEILYPVVESCLPEDILLAWQRNADYKEKLDDLIKFLNQEVHNKMDRTLAKMQFSLAPEVSTVEKKSKGKQHKDIPTATGFMATAPPDKYKKEKGRYPCGFCGDMKHKAEACGKAKLKMTMDEKVAALKERNCCFRCLRPGHSSKKCKAFVKCCFCGKDHYEVMCRDAVSNRQGGMMMMATGRQNEAWETGSGCAPVYQQQMPNHRQTGMTAEQVSGIQRDIMSSPRDGVNNTMRMSNVLRRGKGRVVMMTIIAVMETPLGKWRVRIFIDEGSEESYIETWCAEKFGCERVGSQTMIHHIFGAKTTPPIGHKVFKVTLSSLDGNARKSFELNSLHKITEAIKKPELGPWRDTLERQGIHIHDQSDATEEVQILIGLDIAAEIFTGGFLRLNDKQVARETIFGWVVGGRMPTTDVPVTHTTSNMVTSMMVNSCNVEDLWALEALGIQEDSISETKEDLERATIQHFQQTVQRKSDGRYVVSLPWKDGHRNLVGNFGQAFYRLKNMTRDLQEQGYWNAYDQIFKDWEQDGIIQKAEPEVDERNLYLLPHRHVVKESSSTTPVRPVFDASAKGKGGPSLNDCLEKGPNLLELIPAIMCRFRKEEFAAVADVKKAFLQIELAKNDQEALHFLWWKDRTCNQLQVYHHCRVVFGVKPSPFLLAATLKYHLEKSDQTVFTSKLLDSLYVDNCCSSHATMNEALEFKDKAQQLLLPAHFDLRGWEFSHSKEVSKVPVLGMQWETMEDTISLCLDSPQERMNAPMTKRGLLSLVNSVFDPMGYVCAFTIQPKLLLQEICEMKLGWDTELPGEMAKKINCWKEQVSLLEQLRIPRWIGLDRDNNGVSIHCFTDASGHAFASYVFVRTERGLEVKVQLVMGKSRVAPSKKKVTIPRLELLGCEMGAMLTVRCVKKYLELDDVPCHYWTDSSTALIWITHEKDWARFVENRVKVIRSLTKQEEWHHIPGELNPADVPSRGCGAKKLLESKFWEGPPWLKLPEEEWPKSHVDMKDDEVNAERKKTVVSAHAQVKRNEIMDHLLRYSSYSVVLRVLCYVLRFVERTRKSCIGGCNDGSGLLTAEEVQKSENNILRWIQAESFSGPDDTRLAGKGAFLDDQGLIRIKTQLIFGEDEFGMRFPVVLPNEHPMVKVIIRKEHFRSHAGVKVLHGKLREQFWILHGGRTISNVVNACMVCKRFTGKKCEVPRAPLPLDRIRDTSTFDVIGVDLAGPLTLKGGQKVWIVLFTCAVYRAVHLELVTTLSTRGFMMALQRFVARRGRPSTAYSDNGLNFVGCNNLFRKVNWEEVGRYAAVERIQWKFNPPTAAWWGGFWERLVGLTKQLLRRTLGRKSVDYEELLTLLCDVEGCLNQRPLTYISEGKDELRALCPAFFLRDNPQSNLPEADVVEGESLRIRAKVCHKLRMMMRGRFRREYLGMLQQDGGSKMVTVNPGDVVIVEDINRKRLDWQLGRVKETYPGRDGLIRTALVKTAEGEFLRPVQRLVIMELADGMKSVEEPSSSPQESTGNSVDQEGDVVTKYGRKVRKPTRFGK